MSPFQIIELPTFSDHRGNLTVLENLLPFIPKRYYWIYGTANDEVRGGHRHHKSRQALIAMNGTVNVYLNNGLLSSTVDLINAKQCLIVEPIDWHSMKFSLGSILLVFSSHTYDVEDYIDEAYPSLT
jgi:WxcM-like, C-terminal